MQAYVEGQEVGEVARAVVAAGHQLVASTIRRAETAPTPASLSQTFRPPCNINLPDAYRQDSPLDSIAAWKQYTTEMKNHVMPHAAKLVEEHVLSVRCAAADIAAGAELFGSRGQHIVVAAEGAMLHVWKSRREARRFHEALRRVAQAKFEHMIPSPIHVPLAALVCHQGAYVSVVWLPPLVSATAIKLESGSAVASLVDILRAGLGLPMATPPMSLYPGLDLKLYVIPTLESCVVRFPGPSVFTLAARGELLSTLDQPVKDVAALAAKEVVPRFVDLFISQRADELGPTAAPAAAVGLVSGLIVGKTMHAVGLNISFIGHIAHSAEQRLASSKAAVKEAERRPGVSVPTQLTTQVFMLERLVDTIRGEMLARALKTLLVDAMDAVLVPSYAPAEAVEMERYTAAESVLEDFLRTPAFFERTLLPRMREKFSFAGVPSSVFGFKRADIVPVLAGVIFAATTKAGLDLPLGSKAAESFAPATCIASSAATCPATLAEMLLKTKAGSETRTAMDRAALRRAASERQRVERLRGGTEHGVSAIEESIALANAPQHVLEDVRVATARDASAASVTAAYLRAMLLIRGLMATQDATAALAVRMHLLGRFMRALQSGSDRSPSVNTFASLAIVANICLGAFACGPEALLHPLLIGDERLVRIPDTTLTVAAKLLARLSNGIIQSSVDLARARSHASLVAASSPRACDGASTIVSLPAPCRASTSHSLLGMAGSATPSCFLRDTPTDELLGAELCHYAFLCADEASEGAQALVAQWVLTACTIGVRSRLFLPPGVAPVTAPICEADAPRFARTLIRACDVFSCSLVGPVDSSTPVELSCSAFAAPIKAILRFRQFDHAAEMYHTVECCDAAFLHYLRNWSYAVSAVELHQPLRHLASVVLNHRGVSAVSALRALPFATLGLTLVHRQGRDVMMQERINNQVVRLALRAGTTTSSASVKSQVGDELHAAATMTRDLMANAFDEGMATLAALTTLSVALTEAGSLTQAAAVESLTPAQHFRNVLKTALDNWRHLRQRRRSRLEAQETLQRERLHIACDHHATRLFEFTESVHRDLVTASWADELVRGPGHICECERRSRVKSDEQCTSLFLHEGAKRSEIAVAVNEEAQRIGAEFRKHSGTSFTDFARQHASVASTLEAALARLRCMWAVEMTHLAVLNGTLAAERRERATAIFAMDGVRALRREVATLSEACFDGKVRMHKAAAFQADAVALEMNATVGHVQLTAAALHAKLRALEALALSVHSCVASTALCNMQSLGRNNSGFARGPQFFALANIEFEGRALLHLDESAQRQMISDCHSDIRTRMACLPQSVRKFWIVDEVTVPKRDGSVHDFVVDAGRGNDAGAQAPPEPSRPRRETPLERRATAVAPACPIAVRRMAQPSVQQQTISSVAAPVASIPLPAPLQTTPTVATAPARQTSALNVHSTQRFKQLPALAAHAVVHPPRPLGLGSDPAWRNTKLGMSVEREFRARMGTKTKTMRPS
jgi:hypothetical protein